MSHGRDSRAGAIRSDRIRLPYRWEANLTQRLQKNGWRRALSSMADSGSSFRVSRRPPPRDHRGHRQSIVDSPGRDEMGTGYTASRGGSIALTSEVQGSVAGSRSSQNKPHFHEPSSQTSASRGDIWRNTILDGLSNSAVHS
jgi:hypothetical protein